MQTNTTKELIEKLEQFQSAGQGDLPVVRRTQYEDFHLDEKFGIVCVWRGSEDDLTFTTGESKFTVSSMIDYLKSLDGEWIMSHKGVEIEINLDQNLWADNIGCVTECGIVDVKYDESINSIYVVVAEDSING